MHATVHLARLNIEINFNFKNKINTNQFHIPLHSTPSGFTLVIFGIFTLRQG